MRKIKKTKRLGKNPMMTGIKKFFKRKTITSYSLNNLFMIKNGDKALLKHDTEIKVGSFEVCDNVASLNASGRAGGSLKAAIKNHYRGMLSGGFIDPGEIVSGENKIKMRINFEVVLSVDFLVEVLNEVATEPQDSWAEYAE